jgi:hypothetical protein
MSTALNKRGQDASLGRMLAHPEWSRILDVLRREAESVCHLEDLLN